VKQQVAASMFLGVSLEASDRMCIPEFEMIRNAAKELQEDSQNKGSMPAAGTLGKARIF